MRHRTGAQDRGSDPATIRWVDKRDAYIRDHPLLLSLASTAALGGACFVVFPSVISRSALGVLPGGSERIWSLILLAGGLLIIDGMRLLDSKREVWGLLLMAGCHTAYGYAIFAFRGFAPGAASATVFVGLAFGLTLRAATLRFEPEWRPWSRRRS